MKLGDQVCSLEQAKILKEFGVEQKSLFYYCQEKTPTNPNMVLYGYKQEHIPTILVHGKRSDISTYNIFSEHSAFTVAELGAMLPINLNPNGGISWNWYHRYNWKGHSVGYSSYGQKSIEQSWFKFEADARADMLIYLLSNNITSIEQVNNSIKTAITN